MSTMYEDFKEDGWVVFLGIILCFQMFIFMAAVNASIKVDELKDRVDWIEAQQDNVIETLIER